MNQHENASLVSGLLQLHLSCFTALEPGSDLQHRAGPAPAQTQSAQ